MPISDPVERRSVLPGGLAFREGGDGSGSGGAIVSYQQQVTQVTQIVNNITTVEQQSNNLGLLRAVLDAEKRAKHYTSVHGKTWLWDIATTTGLDFPLTNAIPFSNPVIQSPGNQYANSIGFRHRTWKGANGTWLVGAFIQINFVALQMVKSAMLQVWRNNAIYKVIDACDVDITGDGASMRDCVLRGTVPIVLDVGDWVDFRLETTQGAAPGGATFLHPQSVQGYCWGALQRCGQDEKFPADDGKGFVWV